MATMRLTFLLAISLMLGVMQEEFQPATLQPELIAGPWELASKSGFDGIFIHIGTSSSDSNGRRQIAWQTIDFGVYHRQGGKESWEWFATKEKATPESYNMQDDHSLTFFDGRRLRIHSIGGTDLRPFDLDITFSPATQDWTGTWSRSGQNLDVVLKRPAPDAGATPGVFVGDWMGDSAPDSPSRFAPGRLHIRQSRDGTLTAWLDRTISGFDPKTSSVHNDERNGERLKINSVTDSELVLETSSWTGPPYKYRGSLSEDHEVLTGIWELGAGGRLNAPERFRREH